MCICGPYDVVRCCEHRARRHRHGHWLCWTLLLLLLLFLTLTLVVTNLESVVTQRCWTPRRSEKQNEIKIRPGNTTLSRLKTHDVVVVVLNSHNQVRRHRTGPSDSGAGEYPRENTHNPRWYTHISHPMQFMPPPETYGCTVVL